MRETTDDLRAVQELLDQSYTRAGAHLSMIHTPTARLDATALAARLDGMQVFVVATATADGRPRTGPVDGFWYRGVLRFGTSPTAVRARHLARRPAVSATHVRGEGLVVTVHGTAAPLDMAGADTDFREFLRAHYGPEAFDRELDGAPYYRVDAEWLFAADMAVHAAGS